MFYSHSVIRSLRYLLDNDLMTNDQMTNDQMTNDPRR